MAALALVPPPSTLREHIAEVETLCACVEALDAADELSPEEYEAFQLAIVNAITAERAKVDRVAAAIASFDAAADAAEREASRLLERKKRMQRASERLHFYVLTVLDTSNLKRLEGHTTTLASRNNPPKVVITDETTIPAEYFRYPPPPAPVPDKTAIKAAIQSGVAVQGAAIAQSQRLVIS